MNKYHTLPPSLVIYHGDRTLTAEQTAERLNELEGALHEAHAVLLHEMDNGRTPTMLKGRGLGHFEDVLDGVTNPVGPSANTRTQA